MKNAYVLDYLNENKFRKREGAVKKYNMLAFKKLIFDFYPSFRRNILLPSAIVRKTDNKERWYIIMEQLIDQFKAFSEKDQNWLLSFLDFWREHPVEASAFLDRLRKGSE